MVKKIQKLFIKFKNKFNIKSNFQLGLIFFIFSITGGSMFYIKKIVNYFFGFNEYTPLEYKVLLYIFCFFPLYYSFLLLYAFIFGQWDFFWNRMKERAGRIKKIRNFIKKRK